MDSVASGAEEDGRSVIVMTARTHVGRVRVRNEDSCRTVAERGLALVADGMGGLAAGDVASRTAADHLLRVLMRRGAVHPDILARAVHQADRAVQKVRHAEGLAGMGTTVVVWQYAGRSRALVAHVGDSRCYREHAGELQQITRDHTVVQQALDAGLMTAEAARLSPHRHLITQALGLGDPVSVDVTETAARRGDRFLLCSDGLTDMVAPGEMANLFNRFSNDDALADALVDSALASGGRDNVSLVLIRL